MPATQPIPASAKGALAERPFARLIVFLYRKRVTGHLAITDDKRARSSIFLRKGVPVYVEHGAVEDRLDRVLVDAGIVSQKKLAEIEAERSRGGQKLGRLLEDMGVVDHRVLTEGLRMQVRRKLQRLFRPQRGDFEVFLHDHEFGRNDELERLGVEPPRVIYPGIRGAYDEPRLSRELSVVGDRVLKLPDALDGVVLEDMEFSTSDQVVLNALRSRGLRVADIPANGLRPFDAKAVMLSLLYTDLLRLGQLTQAPLTFADATDPDPPASTASRSDDVEMMTVVVDRPIAAHGPPSSWLAAAAARSRRPATISIDSPQPGASSALREEILGLTERIDTMTLFETLQVPDATTPSEIEVTYFKAVKRFHPDRLRAAGLTDLRVHVERIIARMNEARNVLTDPRKREAYVASLKYGEAERKKARDALEAEFSFQKGESFLRRGDFPRAQDAFTHAVAQNPDEPEHKALLAWTRFINPALNKEEMARAAVKTLREVVGAKPAWSRGYLFLGMVWKFLGDEAKAEGCFKNALSADPRAFEAERELRLLERRRGKGARRTTPASGGPGLFGRFRRTQGSSLKHN